jgi:hypothetical protein
VNNENFIQGKVLGDRVQFGVENAGVLEAWRWRFQRAAKFEVGNH